MNNKIALGCMRLAKLSYEEAEQLILCAIENGIELFDQIILHISCCHIYLHDQIIRFHFQ